MAWREVSVKGKELGSDLKHVFGQFLDDFEYEKKRDIHIPIKNGSFIIEENEFSNLQMILTIDDPSEAIKEEVFKNALALVRDAALHSNRYADLFVIKTLQYENEPLEYRMRVDNESSFDFDQYSVYVLPPHFPIEHDFEVINGIPYVNGIDQRNHQILLQIAKEAEKQGFKFVEKDLPRLKQVHIYPRKLSLGETIDLWKKNDSAFLEGSITKREKGEEKIVQSLSLELNSDFIEFCWEREECNPQGYEDFSHFIGDVITDLNLKIEPDEEVFYDEPYEASVSKGAKKLYQGAGFLLNKAFDVIWAPVWYGADYIKKIQEAKKQKKDEREALILKTLKEEAPEGGYIQLDVEKLLKLK